MITIRRGAIEDAKGIGVVAVKVWNTAYKGTVPDAFLENLSVDEREQAYINSLKKGNTRKFVYVVENEQKEIVGFVIGGENRSIEDYPEHDGELHAIYLLEEYHGKEIGTKLVQAFVNELKDNHFNKMIVWVLADNPAKYFYEKLGGKYLGEKQLELAGKKLDEYVYAWEDLEQLEKLN